MEQYKRMWTDSKNRYLIVGLPNGSYSIFDKEKVGLVQIEDDNISSIVIKNMLDADIEIISNNDFGDLLAKCSNINYDNYDFPDYD